MSYETERFKKFIMKTHNTVSHCIWWLGEDLNFYVFFWGGGDIIIYIPNHLRPADQAYYVINLQY